MCPTRYFDTLNPLLIPLPLIPPHPTHSSPPPFPSLPNTHTLLPPLPTINHPTRLTCFNAALINARSLRNKIPSISSLMTDHDIDILFITETWLSPLDSPHIAALNTPPTASFTTLATIPIPVAATEYFTNLL